MIALVCSRPSGADTRDGRVSVLSAAELRDTPIDVESQDLLWVDVAQPQAEDLAWLERTFHFHPLALEDVASRHQRPKIDEYPGYYFGVLYAARINSTTRGISVSELQFFWGSTYLVTIHTDPFPEIDDLAARARAGTLAPVIDSTGRALAIVDLAYRLIDAVVDGYFVAVDALAEASEDLEQAMFSSPRTQDTLQSIFALKRNLLYLRKTHRPES